MKLYVDLGTGNLIEGPGFRNPVTSLKFKRGDAATLEVVFLADGTTVAELANPANLEMHFGVKARNEYDEEYLVHTSDWTLPSYGAVNPVYRCSPSFNTTELNTALGIGGAGDELPELLCMGEISWRVGAGEPTSTRTFLVVVENDVNRGTEGVPVSAQPPYPAPENLEYVARKGVANGYAGLDSGGKVPWTQLNVGKDSMHSTGGSIGQVLTAVSDNKVGWETPETKGAAKHAGEIVHVSTVDLVGGTGVDVGLVSLGTPPAGVSNLLVLCTSHVSGSPTANELYISDVGTGLSSTDRIVSDDGLSPQLTATELVVTLPDPVAVALPKACVARFVSAGVEMFVTGRLNAEGDTASLTFVWVKGGSDALVVDAARQVFGTLPIANGGTGATTAATARAALGIQSVGDSILTAADLPAVNAILDINRRRNRAVMCESDFFAVGSAAIGGITGAGIASGTSYLAGYNSANHPGVAQLVASTSANSGYYYGSAGAAALLLQGGEKATFVFMIGATESTVYGRLGYVDSFSTTAPTDGIYLSTIGDGAGGVTVTGKASNNTSITTTSSSYTLAASTWVTGVVELSADAATATYSLYSEAGSLLWSDTITSPNLPTGAGRHTSYGVVTFRTDATTADVLLSLDYACWEINRTLIR